MKLSKKNLVYLLKDDLSHLGYHFFKDDVTGSAGLFVKSVLGNKFLTLGLTISNQFMNRFTASYYLSRITRWGSVWGDIPVSSYRRVGAFLRTEERQQLLGEEYVKDKVIDAWWNFSDPNAIESFVNTIKITEERLLNQEALIAEIESSIEIDDLYRKAIEVIERIVSIRKGNQNEFENSYVLFDKVPLDFVNTAESVLLKEGSIRNINLVKHLASDAWRIYCMRLAS